MPRKGEGGGEAASGSLSVTIDGALVCIAGADFWTSSIADTHFRELRRVVATARPLHARFKVLVDLRASAVQTREITDRIEGETRTIWAAVDRIAMVLRPGLTRMQMNRIIDGQNHQSFDSIDLARNWLDQD